MELEKYIESLTLTIRTSEEVRLKKDEVKGSIKKCCKNIFLVVLHRPPPVYRANQILPSQSIYE